MFGMEYGTNKMRVAERASIKESKAVQTRPA
jgi:hypothetical protein